jgi:hypothetical protein
MSKGKRKELAPGIRTGRVQDDRFSHLISPLGADGGETPTYSPAREVGEKQPKSGRNPSEVSRNDRRGG